MPRWSGMPETLKMVSLAENHYNTVGLGNFKLPGKATDFESAATHGIPLNSYPDQASTGLDSIVSH